MANNKKINVTELDFDNIKANLKSFLQGQSEFQDYNFEGSAMSVLLDVLAYNTHYNALYNNMAINEMFLDSARKRNNIVSLAKMLGYTPRSATCAKAIVTITVSGGNSAPANLTLPAYSTFTTIVDGKQYNFFNTGSITTTRSTVNGNFVFTGVEITEGSPLSYNYVVSDGIRYIIPNNNVDVNTLKVRVQQSATSSVYETWTRSDSIVTADATTKAYWIKEIDNGLYELNFGDGNVGRALDNGNVLHLDYFVSSLDAANGATQFTYNGSTLLSGAQVSVVATSAAANGDTQESNDSIRFNAPKFYAAQNRCVTPDDYKALIYANLPEASSVAVWGGEDNNPPVYGKTYLCIKPKNAAKLTSVEKANIISTILTNRNVVSVIPEIVDPEYINIAPTINVYYNEQETTKTASEIATLVRQTVLAYNDSDLQKFDGVFRFSKLSKLIDETDPSIVSNIMTILLRRKLQPRYNVSAQYLLNMINPIYKSGVAEDAIVSTGFYIAGSPDIHYLNDDGVQFMRLFKYGQNATKIYVDNEIGTIDYAKGIIDIRNLNITGLADVDFEISIAPQSNDVVSALTQIAEIAVDHLRVNAIADKTASGDLRGGYNYVFSSSRSENA
jgi:hypothetical protein